MTVVIRKARKEELSTIYEIERLSFKEPYPRPFLESLLVLANDLFLVAEIDKRIVGYAVAVIRERFMGHVISIAVHPNFRRRGIATALLRELLNKLRNRRARFVRLEVRITNKAAIKLYKKLEFREVYVIPNYYPDGEACYVMVREL